MRFSIFEKRKANAKPERKEKRCKKSKKGVRGIGRRRRRRIKQEENGQPLKREYESGRWKARPFEREFSRPFLNAKIYRFTQFFWFSKLFQFFSTVCLLLISNIKKNGMSIRGWEGGEREKGGRARGRRMGKGMGEKRN